MTSGPETPKYTLWLMPDPDADQALSNIISSLAVKFSTPRFKPHITLASLPDLPVSDLKASAISISGRLSSFELSVGKPVCGDPPYQRFCSELHPSDNLLNAANITDEILEGSYAKRHFYHISLLYGNTQCEDLHKEFNRMSAQLPLNLYVQSLALFDTSGKPDEWRSICLFELSR
jgi:2'-5' RNA ligase